MSVALLLLAAALCVAPWRGAATERLRELAPVATSTPAPDRSAPGSPMRTILLSPLLDRVRRRRSGPADTESLARMLDLLAVALLAGLPTHLALAAVGDAVAPTDPDVAGPLH
ncbi:MAG: hypothetical protein Q7T31_05640, partial [Dietzia sp.]|uniref:hypothetical protein n=1 Tax=Dietzia sp. TaxID=1871616 RepID=UPI002724FE24